MYFTSGSKAGEHGSYTLHGSRLLCLRSVISLFNVKELCATQKWTKLAAGTLFQQL